MLVSHVTHEMNMHIQYCEGFGISKQEILATEENEGKSDNCFSDPRPTY